MLLDEEGLAAVFRRHARHAEATRRAVARLGPRSPVRRPARIFRLADRGAGARGLRRRPGCARSSSTPSTCRSAPASARCEGKIFRIGHLGHFNDLMLCGTLCGVEMGLHRAGIPHQKGGVAAALEYLGAFDAIERFRSLRGAQRRSNLAAATARSSGLPATQMLMTDQIEQAAPRSPRARSGTPIAAIPDAARPQSEADSYAIQDAVMRRLGERAGGWKVGYLARGRASSAPRSTPRRCMPARPACRQRAFT